MRQRCPHCGNAVQKERLRYHLTGEENRYICRSCGRYFQKAEERAPDSGHGGDIEKSLVDQIENFNSTVIEEWGIRAEKLVLHPNNFNRLKADLNLHITLEPHPSYYSKFLGIEIHVVDFMSPDKVLFYAKKEDGRTFSKDFFIDQPEVFTCIKIKNIKQEPEPEPKKKPRRMIQI